MTSSFDSEGGGSSSTHPKPGESVDSESSRGESRRSRNPINFHLLSLNRNIMSAAPNSENPTIVGSGANTPGGSSSAPLSRGTTGAGLTNGTGFGGGVGGGSGQTGGSMGTFGVKAGLAQVRLQTARLLEREKRRRRELTNLALFSDGFPFDSFPPFSFGSVFHL
jgi:hypothetical protein